MARGRQRNLVLSMVLAFCSAGLVAQTCQTADDMDPAVRSALTAAGQRYFDMMVRGDIAGLRQNATPSVAADVSGLQAAVQRSQSQLHGAQATVRPPFLLEASGGTPGQRSEFFCGTFGPSGQSTTSAVFIFGDLPAGKYGVVIVDAAGAPLATAVSIVVQQAGTDWKLQSLQVKALRLTGHDSDWFIARAKEFQAKGQMHNAWLYYIVARELVSPASFMSTLASDNLYDQSQAVLPHDIPADGKTADLVAGQATYKLAALFPDAAGNDLELIARYQVSDISDTARTYQSNLAVIKALVAKYPEVRGAFSGVVARAVDPEGRDYGTLLNMKDIR